MLLRHFLELDQDYEVEEVHSGSEAMKRIFKDHFDMVLLDYEMKDIKGDRICLMVREENALKDLPVIVVTGHIEIDDKIFREYGATEVLYKPVESDRLIQTIKKHLKS